MAEIGRIVTQLTGFTGAPGYSVHHFFGDPYSNATAQSNVEAVQDYWDGVAAWMPASWRFSVQPDVAVLDEVTGALIRVEGTVPPAQTAFGSASEYAGGVGAVSSWLTDGVHLTKRLRGRTFITPLVGGAYDSTGTIATTVLTALRTATTNLAAVANFGVWGRPVAGAGGDWAACTSGTVKDHVAWLSSRRD